MRYILNFGFHKILRSLGQLALSFLFLISINFTACTYETNSDFPPNTSPVFELLKSNQTGLNFDNKLTQSKEFNVFKYMYFFNGGGIAAGDFNRDGMVDLYFTANMEDNKLFLNEGEMNFKEVTEIAGIKGMEGWTSGASVVDINQDGLLDIYVNQLGNMDSIILGKNQLFVCKEIDKNGIPIFEEKAAEYGLDLVCLSTQSLFFDYDLDGDLDFFQMNHSLHANGTFGQKKTFEGTKHPLSGDRLYENRNGNFVEVTEKAGIKSTVIGYGLGVVAGDVNLDGYPDLYVANDFHENDYLYINQGDGTFKEDLTNQMQHTSRFSMGVDMGDINNDGWQDIITMDMLPDDPYILKTSLAEDGYDVFNFKLRYGYNHQFARNNLHLNNGNSTFSEIGLFANTYATDWSWAPLFFDFDQDGYKDMFITNGIPRRMNDIDYINFRKSDPDVAFKTNVNHMESEEDLLIIEKMPQIKLPNPLLKNQGDLTFQKMNALIKNDLPSYSNGSVYADLDNDGDLDIVTNNIENQPFIYKNIYASKGNFLSFDLEGSEKNKQAIGAKIIIIKKDGSQISHENYPVRGYQSSAQIPIHIGVGKASDIEKVYLFWPDRTYEILENLEPNKTQSIKWKSGLPIFEYELINNKKSSSIAFEEITNETGINYTHKENAYIDFNREGLIPQMVSTEGPALAVGDVNGDGRKDLFFGSSKRKRSALLIQNANGKFLNHTPDLIIQDSTFEDVDAVFEDIENDGDLDLIIASGGNEYRGSSEYLKQRIFINDGSGNFTQKQFFDGASITASCVLPTDFNGDGLVDFFFGGRSVPWKYGEVPNSYLFENLGNGKFKDVISNNIQTIGLVKDGTWKDIDQDGDTDLILAREWASVVILKNEGSSWTPIEVSSQKGWWNSVAADDFDGDGDIDILAGNLGQNSKLKPTKEEPIKMYVNDFDNNKQVEQILTHYKEGKEIPFATYAELTKQLVSLKKKYLFSKDLAKASLNELFGSKKLKEATLHEANEFRSFYFENKGNSTFEPRPLPTELQLAPIEAFSIHSKGAEGSSIIVGGNFYEPNIEMGRYDASFGNVLSINKEGNMSVSDFGETPIKGQIRRIEEATINGERTFILARNGDSPIIIKESKKIQ